MQKLWSWIIIFVVILNTGFLHCDEIIESKFKKIPYYHRVCLKFFFKEFYLKDALGHVLFFNTKPVAITGFYEKKNRPIFKNFFANIIENIHDKCFEKSWNVWKKYECLFPHSNFIFAEDKTIFADGEQVRNIYAINKSSLLRCLENHEYIFREILGQNFSINEFIENLEMEKQVLPLINHDEALLGIILGYGAESALGFKKNEKQTGINLKVPEKCPIWPLGFMGNCENLEVKYLIKYYEEELMELHYKYQSCNNFLKMILMKLCSAQGKFPKENQSTPFHYL